MKVKASFVETREVEITPSTAFQALRQHVLDKAGLHEDYYIDEKGRIVKDDEHWTSHSWIETAVVDANPPTEKLELLRAFKTIGKELDRQNNYWRASPLKQD